MKTDIFYVGEAAKVMKECIDTGSIALTITSPPYDSLRAYEGTKKFTFEDFKLIADQLYRVTISGGVVVWVVNDKVVDGSRTLTSWKQLIYFKEVCGFKVHDIMVYSKTGFSNPSNNRYHQTWEPMFVLVKDKLKTFNPIKDRPNKYAGQSRWGKNMQRQVNGDLKEAKQTAPYGEFGQRFNVWSISAGGNVSTSDKIAFDHPAIFPESLANDHILSWSNPGDIILDPMVGSGTVPKMAVLNERQWIGIDQVDKYIDDVAIPRLSQYTKKLDKIEIL